MDVQYIIGLYQHETSVLTELRDKKAISRSIHNCSFSKLKGTPARFLIENLVLAYGKKVWKNVLNMAGLAREEDVSNSTSSERYQASPS